MGLSRRFLNLIVESGDPAIRSLRRIDLKRLQLFSPTPPPASPRPTTVETMETIQLPDPTFNFRAHSATGPSCLWVVACYPLGHRKVLCTDQHGHSFLYDACTRAVAAMPGFHKPRVDSLSLFVPCDDDEDDDVCDEEGEGDHEGEEGEEDAAKEDERQSGSSGVGRLFVMERYLLQPSVDFEVLFDGNGRTTSRCKLLPPPFVHEPTHCNGQPPEIGSYAVAGGGSDICISVKDKGTWFLDTARHTWKKAGDWTLPFRGKVEYVPELKLWFGLSADGQRLAAADLSSMDSRPQLAGSWKEFQIPEEWTEQEDVDIYEDDVQVVSLGSGRFCIARFFCNWESADSVRCFVVLTAVEVVSCGLDGNGKVKLEMISHKSMCHTRVDGTYIDKLF